MIRHALLDAVGVAHGFGERGDPEPLAVLRPRQVHGARVVRGSECRAPAAPEADAVLASAGEGPVAVVTADCVPVLVASDDAGAVAAIHAGWRGLAAGVVESAVAALRALTDRALRAAVGPHIGPCCYEVDEPVLGALRDRYGACLEAAIAARRDAHADLDLGALAEGALRAAGIPAAHIGRVSPSCTACHVERFHSYRRDGPGAGRLLHFVCAGPVGRDAGLTPRRRRR